MLKPPTAEAVWGIEVSPADASHLEETLPPSISFRNFIGDPPDREISSRVMPLVTFVPWRVWKKIPRSEQTNLLDQENLKMVLLLEEEQLSPEQVEELFNGFLTVLPRPYTAERILSVLEKGRETRAIYQDIRAMAEEIHLEREILSRKNSQLEFLSHVLTNATATLDVPTILARSRRDLNHLLEVDELSAIFFRPFQGKCLEADLYVPGNSDREHQDRWVEMLLDNGAHATGKTVSCYNLNVFSDDSPEQNDPPKRENTIFLPLCEGKVQFGLLALTSPELGAMGRDRFQVLTAAVMHLSMAIRNALQYHMARKLADHDGLTRIHNRQHFDKTLLVELKRHQRQGHSLSILMLDLDHFKSINDTYGHQAGDMVLQEMGKLLTNTIRDSDYPARYGGEEFVVLLPHTTEEQAWSLAERIRKKLAATRFEFRGHHFQVTTSIGIGAVTPKSLQTNTDLIRQADKALYTAKSSGRNMVCLSAPDKSGRCRAC
ncbi:MAG: sensor domain-containing diguanylate cyclase [Desulfovibrionales bacterium]